MVARSTDFVRSGPPNVDLIFVPAWECYPCQGNFIALGRRYGTCGQVNNSLFKFE
jgi:hypothetical protein